MNRNIQASHICPIVPLVSREDQGLLLRSPLVQGLEPELQARIMHLATVRTLRKGEQLFSEGQCLSAVFFLLEGRAREFYQSGYGGDANSRRSRPYIPRDPGR